MTPGLMLHSDFASPETEEEGGGGEVAEGSRREVSQLFMSVVIIADFILGVLS